ncbi:MAG: plasmid related protein [Desulfuromonadaceae bacterium]
MTTLWLVLCTITPTKTEWMYDDDRVANELALQSGDRLFSAYKREGLPKLWIITESDRSVTTVLFPDEY